MSSIREDLERHRSEKLVQWMRDTYALFEMAGLPNTEAAQSILGLVMSLAARTAAMSTISAGDYARLSLTSIQQAREELKHSSCEDPNCPVHGHGRQQT